MRSRREGGGEERRGRKIESKDSNSWRKGNTNNE